MAENEKGSWYYEGIIKPILDALSAIIEKGIDVWVKSYVWLGEKTWFKLIDYWEEREKVIWDDFLTTFQKRGWIDEDSKAEFLKFKKFPFPFKMVAIVFVDLAIIYTWVKELILSVSSDVRRTLYKKYSPMDADASGIVPAAFLEPERLAEVKEILRKQGYSEKQVELLILGFKRSYSEDYVKVLYWRGVLTKEEAIIRLRKLGYKDETITELVETWPVIPGVMDILTMVAHEAFEPDSVELMGLEDEFPEEQSAWLEKQGLSKFWQMKYWAAHWMQPSIGQGFEMLHRDVIGLEELDFLFRTVEIPPYWRDKLTQIAYLPYTRVDVRRMHKLGILTDEELMRSYMDLGYSAEKAEGMTLFTLAYNQQSIKELTKAQILDGYKNDLIDKETTKQLLMEMGYLELETDYMISYEDYEKDKAYQELVLDNIHKRYKLNLIDKRELENQLGKLNLLGDKITTLVEKWELDKYAELRKASKADLVKFLQNKIIDNQTFEDELYNLGYASKYVNWFVALQLKTKE